ncbi:Acyl-[acyl-carrier-protein]--UDP-N-acetylglucosamine [Salinibacter ruber M8]|uniref:Acyl-[acyl-carrier-protein]--UDP-N-acetylglucosam ine n=1 Tax=Salinibacter ruber (strain M8) TaxID=761659 RepID=D5H6G6_SALRM|nr:acetyltransferase [Salinibacter ruber]CBH23621.1 Acyl-[acyl-carrier-protein]--UDP-N-acetylglucosamine [Salinibacter ruber M8]
MADRPFIIVGGGGHARVVASTLQEIGKTILGFTDPDPKVYLGQGIEHLGSDAILADYAPSSVLLTVGVGSSQDTTLRTQLFSELRSKEFDLPSIVHTSAFVASEASVSSGAQIMAGAVIQPGTTVSENVIVNTNASVDHDCEIGPHTHVAPGATISGEVTLGNRVHVGAGASVIQGVHIGARSVVGAGAVVIDDVPPESVVVGIPAVQK